MENSTNTRSLHSVEDHYTNKKGKIQTDIFNLVDTQWRISFYHEDYISKTLTLKDLREMSFKVALNQVQTP